MKRCVFTWVLILCLAMCATALANSWGAPGGTVKLFDKTEYEDYTVAADDYSSKEKTARLIVKNRYHCQLWWVEKVDGAWKIVKKSTAAVYQPGRGIAAADRPKLQRDGDGFGLIYEGESYWFDKDMVLQRASYAGEDGMVTLSYNGTDAYLVEDDGGCAYWTVYGGLKLEDFHIGLMPYSARNAEHMNHMSNMLYEVFNAPVQVTKTDKSKQAVYTAPDKKSFRAAGGKAAVSLKSVAGLTLLGRVSGWDVVAYEVSTRTSRIGYIKAGHVEDGHGWEEEFQWIPAVARGNTFITDDPDGSQFITAELTKGMGVTLLGRYGQFYAYVETTIDGLRARGFVPLQLLDVQEDSLAQIRAHLTGGPYDIWAGGDLIPSNITFYADGTFAAPQTEGETFNGTWVVRRYDPEEQRFWNRPPYVLEVAYSTGRQEQLGLTPMELGFSLTNEEGGGGYRLQE